MEIKLNNRYNEDVKLNIIDGVASLIYDGVLRVGTEEDGRIVFVDPSGGPMLGIESVLTINGKDFEITKIIFDNVYKFYLDEKV